MKTETIPAVEGALGLIKKGLQKHLEKIPGAININEQNSSHTKEGFVLKAKFISPVVPDHHGLDPAFQEYTAD